MTGAERVTMLKTLAVNGQLVAKIDPNAIDCIAQMTLLQDDILDAAAEYAENNFGPGFEFDDLDDVLGPELSRRWNRKLRKLTKIARQAHPVHVDGVDYKSVSTFPVYHSGWEHDGEGHLVETEEGFRIVLSSHGENYFAEPTEVQRFIDMYQDTIVDMTDAIRLATPGVPHEFKDSPSLGGEVCKNCGVSSLSRRANGPCRNPSTEE